MSFKIEVGETYRCGDNLVKIIYHSKDHEERGFYDYVGAGVYEGGGVKNCSLGMYTLSGEYHVRNPESLCFHLQPIETVDKAKQEKLDRIARMEEELKQLKRSLEEEE